KWLSLFLILFLGVGYTARAADEGWEIVEHCFGEATEPPEGWTFDGTMLLTSTGRLHAYRQEWETPRILVFSNGLPSWSALSPDMRWYAVVEFEREESFVFTTFHEKAIRVYSLIDDTQYLIPWENSWSASHRVYGHRLYWLDNEHLLYSQGDLFQEWYRINPFSQEIEQWNSDLDPSEFVYDLAPDADKALFTDWGLDYWVLDRGEDEIQLPIVNIAGWSPDSSQFAAYTGVNYRAQQFVLFDADGSLTETLLEIPQDTQNYWLYSNLWSPSGDDLLFTTDRLYLADIENRHIVDLCLSSEGMRSAVWSPDGNQFALTTYDRDDGIQIFDLETWQRYVVSYHNGSIIGWRSDD
ncbi:MAG: hypothetical protein ABI835_11670, partial [Chloroflexota bacterium]